MPHLPPNARESHPHRASAGPPWRARRARRIRLTQNTSPRIHEVPDWRSWREALAIAGRPRHLHRTLVTALIVGTILFVINQLNVVVAGHATTFVWLKIGLTYLVPFT
ncbi:MAG: nitrate/nitrite transporter NrtS, partial [Solirubrobacteraceae bacterium]